MIRFVRQGISSILNTVIRVCFGVLVILGLHHSSRAADVPYDTAASFTFGGRADSLPTVNLIDGNAEFMRALNPDFYPTPGDVDRDVRWVERNSGLLKDFWNRYGDSVLYSLQAYSGYRWQDSVIDVHLVRFYGSWRTSDPAVLPLDGRRIGGVIEAAPIGAESIIQSIHVVANQLLISAEASKAPGAEHPLMSNTEYHRENLAELLALSVAGDVINHDVLLETINSPEFARRRPGYTLFFRDLWGIWTLSANTPLSFYLSQEPRNGLIRVHADSALASEEITEQIERLPGRSAISDSSSFGLALEATSSGLKVIKSDPKRLAFAYGIVEGDIIRSINRTRVNSLREFYKILLSTYQTTGSDLRIRRGDSERTVTIKLAAESYNVRP